MTPQAAAYANDFNLQKVLPDKTDCMPAGPPEHEVDPPKENCPVLLDLDLDGFHLSGPDPAVRFDIDADGTPDQIAWTRAGVSQPGEIRPAAAAGVVSLDYAFRDIRRRDAFGNLFRYVSRMEMRTRQGKVRPWFNYDVIFADATP